MKTGTMRPEESVVFDSHKGYHRFHSEETQEPYGFFEVFWNDGTNEEFVDNEGDKHEPGWYWWACVPGCLPDGEPTGPFGTSMQAHYDADPWSPEYDD